MRSDRQARCRCLLRLKGEKHHDVKAPLRDPFLDGWTPARERARPTSAESIPVRFRCGFLQKNDGVGRRMRMCIKAQGVYSHQPTTGEEPVEALDPPEPSPWMLTRGIPYSHRVLQPGPRYADFDGTQLSTFVSPPNAQKQASFSRYASDWAQPGKSFANIPCGFLNNLRIRNSLLGSVLPPR